MVDKNITLEEASKLSDAEMRKLPKEVLERFWNELPEETKKRTKEINEYAAENVLPYVLMSANKKEPTMIMMAGSAIMKFREKFNLSLLEAASIIRSLRDSLFGDLIDQGGSVGEEAHPLHDPELKEKNRTNQAKNREDNRPKEILNPAISPEMAAKLKQKFSKKR